MYNLVQYAIFCSKREEIRIVCVCMCLRTHIFECILMLTCVCVCVYTEVLERCIRNQYQWSCIKVGRRFSQHYFIYFLFLSHINISPIENKERACIFPLACPLAQILN